MIFTEISMIFFTELKKKPKICISKKNKNEGITLPDLKDTKIRQHGGGCCDRGVMPASYREHHIEMLAFCVLAVSLQIQSPVNGMRKA